MHIVGGGGGAAWRGGGGRRGGGGAVVVWQEIAVCPQQKHRLSSAKSSFVLNKNIVCPQQKLRLSSAELSFVLNRIIVCPQQNHRLSSTGRSGLEGNQPKGKFSDLSNNCSVSSNISVFTAEVRDCQMGDWKTTITKTTNIFFLFFLFVSASVTDLPRGLRN